MINVNATGGGTGTASFRDISTGGTSDRSNQHRWQYHRRRYQPDSGHDNNCWHRKSFDRKRRNHVEHCHE